MSEYSIKEAQYLHPTPAGAFYIVQSAEQDVSRQMLFRLLQESETPLSTKQLLMDMSGLGRNDAFELTYRLQGMELLQGLSEPRWSPQGPLDEVLPGLLRKLSDAGRVVLAEPQGLYMACAGFTHEAAEELSVLSAELSVLSDRFGGVLHRNLGVKSDAWGLVSSLGFAEVGFWPLHVGSQRFCLIVGGMPRFNQAAFTELVWVLVQRYAQDLHT